MYLFDKNKDLLTVVVIFLVSFFFYFVACKELLSTGFYQQMNIAFDLDQNWYFDLIGREPIDWLHKTATTSRPLAIKHPFIYLYHYLVLFLNSLGLTDSMSVVVISQIFHSGSLVVSYFIFRCLYRTSIESAFLTFGLAGTSTYISTGLVLDIYSLSIFWISIIFLIVCRYIYHKHKTPIWYRAIVSVMAIGTTSYLIILVFLMELFLAKKPYDKLFHYLIKVELYKQLFRIFIIGILLFCFIYYQVIIDIIQDPIGILKRTFWTVNRPGEKSGVIQIVSVFMLFSIISPKISNITLPEGIIMKDLRTIDFSFIGWVGVTIIMGLFIFSFKKNKLQSIALFCLFWIVINIFFHSIYQYRGSLFLYCGHFILSLWILYFTLSNKTAPFF